MKLKRFLEKSANVKLNETQRAILQYIREEKNRTLKELATLIEKDEDTIARNIKALKEKGFIEHIGSDKTGCWEVLK